ncbi:hypothetical protein I8F96_11250 [Enterococcus casseliflavus]|nr:hypothetical protein [Enterococcus casseliflavus]
MANSRAASVTSKMSASSAPIADRYQRVKIAIFELPLRAMRYKIDA